MDKLTNTIEAILFAAGNAVSFSLLAEKLQVDVSDIRNSVEELKTIYTEESGIQVLTFNNKVQLGTNPLYKEEVASVLNPIKEKEFTKTILECAAIIAYKQPITRTELEEMRGVSSDYAVRALLDLDMIYPCGRKEVIGKPILYATTDNFLKRFKLTSLSALPDYDELMKAIADLNPEEEDDYLYKKDVYDEQDTPSDDDVEEESEKDTKEEKTKEEELSSDYNIPDFLKGLKEEDLIKIE